tara:strand:- start:144 stop:317 length:174 start_codon:yes stop_codon:yes gene_type:complete
MRVEDTYTVTTQSQTIDGDFEAGEVFYFDCFNERQAIDAFVEVSGYEEEDIARITKS